MASIVTGIIGGFQARSAAKNAASAQEEAARRAAGLVTNAVGQANPLIGSAADLASQQALGAANTAGAGVLNASNAGIAGINGAVGTGAAGVNSAVQQANSYLDPYAQAGTQALTSLTSMGGGRAFTADDMEQYDPGYAFRLAQGQQALERSQAARGSGLGGGALKELTRYAQGTASQEYGAAFDRFQRTQQQQISNLTNLAGAGLQAGGMAGSNLTNAARYAGDLGFAGAGQTAGLGARAAEYGGNAGINAAQFGSNAQINSAGAQAQNLLNAAQYAGNSQLRIGDAQASGHIGAANAWNGMLGSIGNGVNSAIGGGFSGGGGFSVRDAFRWGG